jgi:hypothetical protein
MGNKPLQRKRRKGKERNGNEVKEKELKEDVETHLSLLEILPMEIWVLIMSWVPVKEGYPSCFLINRLLHSTLKDENGWLLRCQREFNISVKNSNEDSWCMTYQRRMEIPFYSCSLSILFF